MALEQFTNVAYGTVTSGGTTTGSTSWTVTTTSVNVFPGASSALTPPTVFKVSDPAQPSETIIVTSVSGTAWTVVRGADGTAAVAHAAGFTVYQVASAGSLGSFPQTYNARSATYGAKGDGATDDTTALQAALTACHTAGGGTVYVPEGVYLISQTLQVSSNTVLGGAGMQVTTIRAKASFAATQVGTIPGMVMITSAGGAAQSNIRLTGMTVDGNLSNIASLPSYASGNQVLCSPVNFWMVDNLAIEEIEVINPIGYAVFSVGCTHFSISRNRVITGQVYVNGYVQQDALHTSSCQYGVIEGNHINTGNLSINGANQPGQNVGDDGICIQGIGALGPWAGGPCSDITVTGNVVQAGAARGISLVLGGYIVYSITIAGNDISHTQHEGMVFEYGTTGSGSPYLISDITVTGNTFSNMALGGSGRGVTMDDATNIASSGPGWADVSFTGNIFSTISNTAGAGIYAQGGSGLVIAGNIFDNWNAPKGIQIGDNISGTSCVVTDFTVSGNVINLAASATSTSYGVVVIDSHDGTICGNTAVGTAGASSAGVWLGGVSATNLVTGIAVTGNRLTAWGYGLAEVNGGAAPSNNLFSGNSLFNCTVGTLLIGPADTVSGNSAMIAGSAQTVTTGTTITITSLTVARITGTGTITGLILPVGTYAGQTVTIINEGAVTMTFNTTPATSHVADAAATDVIPALACRTFVWDTGTSFWYRSG